MRPPSGPTFTRLVGADATTSAGMIHALSASDAAPNVELPNGTTCCVPPVLEEIHRSLMQNYAAVSDAKKELLALRLRAGQNGQEDIANWIPSRAHAHTSGGEGGLQTEGARLDGSWCGGVRAHGDSVSVSCESSSEWRSGGFVDSTEGASASHGTLSVEPTGGEGEAHFKAPVRAAVAFDEDDDEDVRQSVGAGRQGTDAIQPVAVSDQVDALAGASLTEPQQPITPPMRPPALAGSAQGPLTEDDVSTLEACSRYLAQYFAKRGELLREADARLVQHANYHMRLEGETAAVGCYGCGQRFGQRHHCRRCGHQFCATCAGYCGRHQDSSGASTATVVCTEYVTAIVALDRGADSDACFLEEVYDTYTCMSAKTSSVAPAQGRVWQAVVAHTPASGSTPPAVTPEDRVGSVAAVQRLCAACYMNCLVARKSSLISTMRSANRYILGDGLYYFSVLGEDETGLTALLNHPEEAKMMAKQTCQRILEQSVPRTVAGASQASGRVVVDGGKVAFRAVSMASAYLTTRWSVYRRAAVGQADGDSPCHTETETASISTTATSLHAPLTSRSPNATPQAANTEHEEQTEYDTKAASR